MNDREWEELAWLEDDLYRDRGAIIAEMLDELERREQAVYDREWFGRVFGDGR